MHICDNNSIFIIDIKTKGKIEKLKIIDTIYKNYNSIQYNSYNSYNSYTIYKNYKYCN